MDMENAGRGEKEGYPLRSMDIGRGGGKQKRRRTRCVCLSTIAVLLGLVVLIVILAFTVFKAKRPVTTVDSVSLDNFSAAFDFARLRVLVNLTLDIDLSIYNPNKVGFKYDNSSAFLEYRGQVVGEVPVPAGKIGSDDTINLNLTLDLMADRLIANGTFYADVLNGTLPLETISKISGKVRILNLFNIRVVSTTTCDLDVSISLTTGTLRQQNCHYKTKLR